MTPRMYECLKFLEKHIGEKGYAPSFAEISEHFEGMSKSGVHRLVHGLASRGKINILGYRARSISLVNHCKCPNCGFTWNAPLTTTGPLKNIPTESVSGSAGNVVKL